MCRPTDAAIRAFLRDMNLTVDELKQRPLLAKQLVAQHTLLGEDGKRGRAVGACGGMLGEGAIRRRMCHA